MKKYFFSFLILITFISLRAQNHSIIKITKIYPLLCFNEFYENVNNKVFLILESDSPLFEKNCIRGVRITVENSDIKTIKTFKFILTILGQEGDVLYRGEHNVELTLKRNEVKTFDLTFDSKISSFQKELFSKKNFKWKTEILKTN